MTKACSKCKQIKPASAFYRATKYKSGLQSRCKACQKADQSSQYDTPERSEYMRWYFMRVNYGITKEQYEQLLADQGGVCRICGIRGEYVKRPGKTVAGLDAFGLCIDHDHETGVIRGLLCNNCNRAIGLFKDSPELLEHARGYLLSGGARMQPAAQRTRATTAPRSGGQGPLLQPPQEHREDRLRTNPDVPSSDDPEA